MSINEIAKSAMEYRERLKNAKKKLTSFTSVSVNNIAERDCYTELAGRWFDDFSAQLIPYGVNRDIINKYDLAFKAILKLSERANRRSSYIKQFDFITINFNEDIVLFLQTDAKTISCQDKSGFEHEVIGLLSKISDKGENDYLKEALGCWKSNYLKGATILLWCAAIDRVHKVIEKIGFEQFNKTSLEMKLQSAGRFKRFTKEYSIKSISELRSTVFDSDLLWVLEGMQLIDANERTRLASCFDMRCHSGHPGDAPITKFNVLSCFSDVVEIVLANPKFQI